MREAYISLEARGRGKLTLLTATWAAPEPEPFARGLRVR